MHRKYKIYSTILAALLTIATFIAPSSAKGQVDYSDRYDFAVSSGSGPIGGVVFDSFGNMYGTAFSGGSSSSGCIWEWTESGSFLDLHDFGGTVTLSNGTLGSDGSGPFGSLLMDGSGDLFGMTQSGGGTRDQGMVWELTSAGTYIDLHDFGGPALTASGVSVPDGENPQGGVGMDSAGNVFGCATLGGAASKGVIWKITAGGTYTILHSFGGTITDSNGSSGLDGEVATGSVEVDGSGNVFGVARIGGLYNHGMAWKLDSSGNYFDLHDFGGTVVTASGLSGPDGGDPDGGVTLDGSGNLYGTTIFSGPNVAAGGNTEGGNVWEITSTGVYIDLHDFGGTVTKANGSGGTDGVEPAQCLIEFDTSGNLYGVAANGGQHGKGIVWEITTTGTYIDLHDFGGTIANADGSIGPDGTTAAGGVGWNPYGVLYGTAQFGGANSEGLIWSVPVTISGLSLSLNTVVGGNQSVGTVTLNEAAPSGGATVTLQCQWPSYVSVPATITIPEGESVGVFLINVPNLYSATFTNSITAICGTAESVTLTVTGEKLTSLVLNPSTIGGAGSTTGTVTLSNPAPVNGWKVKLAASTPSYITMPTSILIPKGATTATFRISSKGQITSTVTCAIHAVDEASGVSAELTLQGNSVTGLSLSPSSIGWSGTSVATVSIANPAPASGWVVSLHAGASGYLSIPSTVTVPAGATSATFSVLGASQHSGTMTIGVFATDANSSAEAPLTLTGTTLQGISLSPSSVTPGKGSTGTVTLNAPAPAGGWVVHLSVGASSLVGVPASVTVPAGSTTATFPITTYIGESATSVSVIANDGGSQVSTTLTIL